MIDLTILFVTIVAMAIGFILYALLRHKLSDWLDALKAQRSLRILERNLKDKDEELKLLRQQNELLKEDIKKTNDLYKELKSSYEKLQKHYEATKFLLEENQKLNKQLSSKLRALEDDYEEFKSNIGNFMVEALGANQIAVNKLLKIK